ncbi:MAG: response regulator [Lachnospiraceae bacterium]|nr:response regulator [Lachnospiraceae bacterium]
MSKFWEKRSTKKTASEQEERLKAAEETIKSVIDYVQSCTIVFDKEGRVQYISESAVEKFGLEKEKQDRTLADFSQLLLNGHSLEELLMIVDWQHPLNEMVRVETREYKAEPWWAAVEAYMMAEETNNGNILLIMKDLTEYFRKNEKEMEPYTVWRDLLYTISRSVKTSLNEIDKTLDLMHAGDAESVSKQNLSDLQQVSEKMSFLLDEVIDFIKAENGTLELRQKEYSVIPVLEELYTYTERAEKQGKVLYMFVSTDIPNAIIGDAKHLQQAISNLLYIFMVHPAKGKKAVELHVTTAEKNVSELMLKVEVRGSSSAMPDIVRRAGGKNEVASSVYDSNEILCEFKYYAVLDFVNLLGGKMQVEQGALGTTAVSFTVPLTTGASENIMPFREFKGVRVAIDTADEDLFMHLTRIARELDCEMVRKEDAAFIWSEHTIRAPYSTMIVADYMHSEIKKKLKDAAEETVIEEETAEEVKKVKEVKEEEQVKALIVDDNVVNAMVAGKLLSTLGIVSETVSDGLEALDRIEQNEYDMILMDHLMPNMDGVQATRKIRELEEAEDRKRTLIIALTASLMDSVVPLFEEAGADDSMAKPIDINILKSILEKYLPKEKLVSAGKTVKKAQEPAPKEKEPEKRAAEPKETAFLQSDELKKVASVCPELDLRKGLSYVAGDEEQYLRILYATKKSISQILEHFDTLALSERKELYIDVHSLKGIFANIGAESLREEAAALEYSLAEDGKLQEENYRKFFRHCRMFQERLEQCMAQKEEMNYSIVLSEEEKEEWKARAKKALCMFDYDLALEAVTKLAAAMMGEVRENLLRAVAEIENFNYESAQEWLEKAFKKE